MRSYSHYHGLLFLSALVGMLVFTDAEEHSADLSCAHGKLYLTDSDSPTLRIIDLNGGGSLGNLTVETTMAVPGHNGQWLVVNPAGTIVKVISWGNESLFFANGQVQFVHAGITSSSSDADDSETGATTATSRASTTTAPTKPTLLEGTSVECRQAYHLVHQDAMLVISCDGSYEDSPPVDNSYYFVDEAMLEQGNLTESAVVHSITAPGSLHGAAYLLGDGIVLHPVPTARRLARVNTTDPLAPLPATFLVVDFQGGILDAINDTSNVDRNCQEAHGGFVAGDTIAIACGQAHGGILVANWNAEEGTTTTRSIMYPADFPGLRVGDWFGQHPLSKYVVSDLSDWSAENATEFYLMAMETTATELTSANVLTVNSSVCGYGFEMTSGQTLVVLLATGMLQLYTVDPTWTLVSEQLFVENMVTCEDAGLAVGYNQVFGMSYADKTLYALNLEDEAASIERTILDFNPYHAVVAKGCGEYESHTNDTHDGDHSGHNDSDTGDSGGSSLSSSALAVFHGMMTPTLSLVVTVVGAFAVM